MGMPKNVEELKALCEDIEVNLIHPEFGTYWKSPDWRKTEASIREDERAMMKREVTDLLRKHNLLADEKISLNDAHEASIRFK